MSQEYSGMNYDDSMRLSINKCRKLCPVSQPFESIESMYSDYWVNPLSVSHHSALCWINQFASFYKPYFLRTSCVIGCVIIFIPLDKQSQTDQPIKSVTLIMMNLLNFSVFIFQAQGVTLNLRTCKYQTFMIYLLFGIRWV